MGAISSALAWARAAEWVRVVLAPPRPETSLRRYRPGMPASRKSRPARKSSSCNREHIAFVPARRMLAPSMGDFSGEVWLALNSSTPSPTGVCPGVGSAAGGGSPGFGLSASETRRPAPAHAGSHTHCESGRPVGIRQSPDPAVNSDADRDEIEQAPCRAGFAARRRFKDAVQPVRSFAVCLGAHLTFHGAAGGSTQHLIVLDFASRSEVTVRFSNSRRQWPGRVR